MDLDNIRGAFLGLFIGDALGLSQRNYISDNYRNDIISQSPEWNVGYGAPKTGAVGQIGESSKMSSALLWRIATDKDWIYDHVVNEYMNCVNSSKGYLSDHSKLRDLFFGVKTIKGYESRKIKQTKGLTEISPESLLRALPLIFLFNYLPEQEAYSKCISDTILTDDNDMNKKAILVYILFLRLIVRNSPPEAVITQLLLITPIDTLIGKAIVDAYHNIKRKFAMLTIHIPDIIYLMIKAWLLTYKGYNFSQALIMTGKINSTTEYLIYPIIGSVLGIIYGEKKMIDGSDPITVQNIQTILNTDYSKSDNPVDPKYQPSTTLRMLS